mmetsp:Transcript_22828/g.53358  ORF Transcript_22828/g.53358 Transcript_22828/m.53358 type:complete len:436 (+) Transcript_22828:149-1456(+)
MPIVDSSLEHVVGITREDCEAARACLRTLSCLAIFDQALQVGIHHNNFGLCCVQLLRHRTHLVASAPLLIFCVGQLPLKCLALVPQLAQGHTHLLAACLGALRLEGCFLQELLQGQFPACSILDLLLKRLHVSSILLNRCLQVYGVLPSSIELLVTRCYITQQLLDHTVRLLQVGLRVMRLRLGASQGPLEISALLRRVAQIRMALFQLCGKSTNLCFVQLQLGAQRGHLLIELIRPRFESELGGARRLAFELLRLEVASKLLHCGVGSVQGLLDPALRFLRFMQLCAQSLDLTGSRLQLHLRRRHIKGQGVRAGRRRSEVVTHFFVGERLLLHELLHLLLLDSSFMKLLLRILQIKCDGLSPLLRGLKRNSRLAKLLLQEISRGREAGRLRFNVSKFFLGARQRILCPSKLLHRLLQPHICRLVAVSKRGDRLA